MSFTDGNSDLNESGELYDLDESVMGRVWVSREGIIVTPPARIRYERRPWIEGFELDGIKPAPAKLTGIGTKGAEGFVRSLSTIYSPAYDEYREYGGDEAFDAEKYFANAANHFISIAGDKSLQKMASKFCGFTENMWREGNEEMLGICIDTIVPELLADKSMRALFEKNITEEFREYLKGDKDNGGRQKIKRDPVHPE